MPPAGLYERPRFVESTVSAVPAHPVGRASPPDWAGQTTGQAGDFVDVVVVRTALTVGAAPDSGAGASHIGRPVADIPEGRREMYIATVLVLAVGLATVTALAVRPVVPGAMVPAARLAGAAVTSRRRAAGGRGLRLATHPGRTIDTDRKGRP